MKNLKTFALAAFALLGFAACQQEDFAPELKNPTHSVTFVAGAPESTKTIVDISDGENAKFAWTKADECNFTVYENGVAASSTTGSLGEDGKMTLMAEFSGTKPDAQQYQALFNTKVCNSQSADDTNYDQTSDVLVSDILSEARGSEIGTYVFRFKRESAIAKMTLKGLTAGDFVRRVTIESDKPIAGEYDLKTGEFKNTSNTITIEALSKVVGDQAVVWFATIPVENAKFTITATVVDNDDKVVGTFTKTFTKTISLSRGDVSTFGVAMVKDAPKTYGYQKISSVEEYAPGDYIIVAHAYKDDCPTKGDFAIANSLTISSDKISGTNVTSIIDNDVISVSDGDSYKLSLSGDKDNIVISNGTSKLGYGTSSTNLVLNGDKTSWSLSLNEGDGGSFILLNNSTASAKTKRALAFQCYSTSGTEKTASLKFAAYAVSNVNKADYAAIELYKYQEVTPPTPKYSIALDDVTGGTLSASTASAEEGAEVTLSATPDKGYEFNDDWTVTNAETSEAITVTAGKFEMPAADVNVTASFKQLSYAITANPAENGIYTVKVGEEVVTTAVYGAKVLLEATPAEGYICDGWTVVDAESKSVYVSNNSFTMPASEVTISTTFSLKPEDITYDHAGTAEDPYSVADVLKYISTLGTATSASEVYAKGVISSITEVSTSFGNATYKIKDEGVENEVLVYRGLYLEGAKFTSASQIGVGDEVVVKGKVKNYNGTMEFDSGNSLVFIVKAPYLNVTASKETGIAASGETVTITVDTNADSWSATSSDNDNFALGTPSENTVKVTVAKNTGEERTAKITITAGTLSKEITLTQVAAGTLEIKDFSTTYGYGLSDWSLTNYSDESSYYKVPDSGDTSIATIAAIFTNKTIQSDIVITLNVATFGSGTNPSASTFTIFANSECTTSVSATQSGSLPTSKTYTDVVYTVTKDDAIAFVKDLAIKITKPGKQIRLKSISVKFKYSE